MSYIQHQEKTIKKKLKVIVPTEQSEHMAFMNWVNTQPLIRDHIIHIANERKCSPWAGAKFRAMGVRAGVCDFFLPIPVKNIHENKDISSSWLHGLWIELKRTINFTCSVDQMNWIYSMRKMGYQAEFAYGCDQAISLVKNYIKNYELSA